MYKLSNKENLVTKRAKKYLALKEKLEQEEDEIIQSELEEKLDELYFELTDEEIEEIEAEELD